MLVLSQKIQRCFGWFFVGSICLFSLCDTFRPYSPGSSEKSIRLCKDMVQ